MDVDGCLGGSQNRQNLPALWLQADSKRSKRSKQLRTIRAKNAVEFEDTRWELRQHDAHMRAVNSINRMVTLPQRGVKAGKIQDFGNPKEWDHTKWQIGWQILWMTNLHNKWYCSVVLLHFVSVARALICRGAVRSPWHSKAECGKTLEVDLSCPGSKARKEDLEEHQTALWTRKEPYIQPFMKTSSLVFVPKKVLNKYKLPFQMMLNHVLLFNPIDPPKNEYTPKHHPQQPPVPNKVCITLQ